MLLLDAGNLLFKHFNIGPGPNQQQITAQTIMQVYQNIGYDAVGVGPLDLAGGADWLQDKSPENFPWISANIMDEHGKPVFPQWISREVQGIDIIITALTGSPKKIPQSLQIRSWEPLLPELLQRFSKEKRKPFIILLSSLTAKENYLIAEQYSAINLLISADEHQNNVSPHLVNETLVTQTEKQGKYQGLLQINFGRERQWTPNTAKQLTDLQNKLGSVNWQLSRLEKKTSAARKNESYSKSIKRLQSDRAQLTEKITSLQSDLQKEKYGGIGTDTYQYQFIGLKKNMPIDIPTEQLLTQSNQKIRELHKKSRKSNGVARRDTFFKPGINLVGFHVCITCHAPQAEFWQTTQHARAYTTLVEKGKNLDLNCLPCHVTQDLFGNGVEKIQTASLLSLPMELQSVGCENCHGSGKKHSTNPEKFKMVKRPGKNICQNCHTPEHDDNFNYVTKLPPVSCP